MKKRFNLNEEEKKHIRGLHGINLINEQVVGCGEQGLDEDATDTPGGNPDYFYDEDSVFAKLRNRVENDDTESMSNDDIGSLNRIIK